MNGGRRPVVGVTGLPCAGKSFVARLLASGEITGEAGVALKADDIGHQVLDDPEVIRELAGKFGPGILDAAGKADRKKIADLVFPDPDALLWLEGALHPRIDRVIADIIAEAGGERLVAVEAALLFAAGMEKRCDLVLIVEADRAVRLRRAAKRGWSGEELARRESRLLPMFEKAAAGGCETRCARVANNDENGLESLKASLEKALAVVRNMKGQS